MTAEQQSHLELVSGDRVVALRRLRTLHKQATIVETIIQPLSIFPDIDKESVFPNSLYGLYQEKYGITIVQVRDELRAVALPEQYADLLELAAGTPVIYVERASINLAGRAVEWSTAFCSTEKFVYFSNLK